MCSVCPNCGFNLERIETIELGELVIDGWGANVFWKGIKVPLSKCLRLFLLAIVLAKGTLVSYAALAEALGYEGDKGISYMSTQKSKIRRIFRQIDPSFALIETIWGEGMRWRMEEV